jgi:hypothetical protein
MSDEWPNGWYRDERGQQALITGASVAGTT